MVNKDNMRKVTQALRSEQYPKTVGNLRDGEGFCALGVACDVSGLGHWQTSPISDTQMFVEDAHPQHERSRSGLTNGVVEWLGLNHRDWGWRVRDENGEWTVVFDLNDSGPETTGGEERDFHQIAALIEKEYEL